MSYIQEIPLLSYAWSSFKFIIQAAHIIKKFGQYFDKICVLDNSSPIAAK